MANNKTLQVNISANAKQLKAAVDDAVSSFKSMDKSTMSVKKSLRMLTQEATNYTAQYRALTEQEKQSPIGKNIQRQIQELINQAGKLQDTLGDTKNAIKQQASDTLYFDAAAQSMDIAKSGIEAFVAATMGADTESKKFKETMAKLAQVETSFNAIIKITNALQKDSALMQALSKAKTDLATLSIFDQNKALALQRLAVIKSSTAYKALAMSMTAVPWVAVIAAIAAVVVAFKSLTAASADADVAFDRYNQKATEIKTKQKSLEEASRSVVSQLTEEKIKVEALYNTVKNLNLSYEERNKALNTLKNKIPEYHGNLSREGKLINDNSDAITKYVSNLEKMAEKQIALSRVVNASLELSRLEVEEKTQQALYDSAEKQFNSLSKFNQIFFANDLVDAMYKANENLKEIHTQQNVLTESLKQYKKDLGKIGYTGEEFKIGGSSSSISNTKQTAETLKKEFTAYEKLQNEKQSLQATITNAPLQRNDGWEDVVKNAQNRIEEIDKLVKESEDQIKLLTDKYPEGMQKAFDDILRGKSDFYSFNIKPEIPVTSSQIELDKYLPPIDIQNFDKKAKSKKLLEDYKELMNGTLKDVNNELNALVKTYREDPITVILQDEFEKVGYDLEKMSPVAKEKFKKGMKALYESFQDIMSKYTSTMGGFEIPSVDSDEWFTSKILNQLDDARISIYKILSSQYEEAQKQLDKIDVNEFFKETVNNSIKETAANISTMVSAIQSVKSEWQSLSDIENPLDKVLSSIMAVVDTVSGIYSFVEAIQGIIEIFNALSIAKKAKAAADVATAPAEIAAQTAQAEAERIRTATENTAAYAAIPFAGPELAAAAQSAYEAIWAAAAIPMFSKGGIFEGKTALGDLNVARVNKGEMILTDSQQGRLFRLLNGTTPASFASNPQMVEFHISGQNLRGVLKNVDNKKSKI